MPSSKPKPNPLPLTDEPDPRAGRFKKLALQTSIYLLGVSAVMTLGYKAYRYVDRQVATSSEPPVVRLVNRPAWMSDYLAERIAIAARPERSASAFDGSLLKDIYTSITTDGQVAPWVKEVRQIRRTFTQNAGDTIEIDCEYRVPLALVKWTDTQGQESFWLVDTDGTKLPERFLPDQVPQVVLGNDGRVNMRIIDGVASSPAPAGAIWQGDDLRAGLEMVKLLSGQPYADEIIKVDVSNFSARQAPRQPHLTLVTRHNTRVLWGRPMDAPDYFVEAAPARKLQYLKDIYRTYGRVDAAHEWVDLRFDKVLYPTASSSPPATGLNGGSLAGETSRPLVASLDDPTPAVR
jgi:hypothetical protein